MNILVLLLFSVWSGLLVFAGAALLERAGTEIRLPLRWTWLAGVWLAAILPMLALASAGRSDAGIQTEIPGSESSNAAPIAAGRASESGDGAIGALYGWWSASADVLDAGADRIPAWNVDPGAIVAGWAGLSLSLALVFLLAHALLLRRVRAWPSGRRLGHSISLSPALGPATIGLFRPRVVLPRWALALPNDELRLILEHEREHVRSRDNMVLWSGLVAVLLCPWNPAVWMCARRLRQAVELDCDARVLGQGASVPAYGRILLDVGSRGRLRLLTVAEMPASPSLLERRLTIMNKRLENASTIRAIGFGSLGGLLLLAACATEAPVSTQPDTRSAAATAVNIDPDRPVIRIASTGDIELDGAPVAEGGLADALAPLRAAGAVGTVTVLEANEDAPYRAVAAVQEDLRSADLLRVVFAATDRGGAYLQPATDRTDAMPGLGMVLPGAAMPPLPNTPQALRNVLFLDLRPGDVVHASRGVSDVRDQIELSQISSVISRSLAMDPNLIVVLRTHPDAPYGTMFRALDEIQSAGATRFMLQTLDAGA